MGLSSQLAPSAIARPGVIANAAARPASPYDGQVVYQQDTDQAYVWNGSAWVLLSTGTANPPGLEHIVSTALSSTTNINNCFSASYDVYRLVITTNSFGGGSANIQMQLTAGGTPNTTAANYAWVGNEQYTTSFGLVTFGANGSAAQFTIGRVDTARQQATAMVDVINPFATQFTGYQAYYTDAITFGRTGGALSVNTSYDGVRLYITGTPSWTGWVRVYGYRN